jgi:hypothetical protein
MGLRDTAEQLDACREQSRRDEHRIQELEIAFDLERKIVAELEAENVRLESALADRLRHDRHGVAATEADLTTARERLARIHHLIDPRRDDPQPLPAAVIRRILDETTAEPEGVYLPPDDADTIARALRGLAGVIRAVPWHSHSDGTRIDANHLDTLANHLDRSPTT